MELRWIALLVYLLELLLLMPRLPLWLFVLALLGLGARAIAQQLHLGGPPRLLLFIVGIMALSLTLTDTPSFWHKETATAAILIVAQLLLWDRPRPRQLMLLHCSFFAALVALLVTAGVQLPLFIYFGLTLLIFISLMLHHLPGQSGLSPWQLSRRLLRTAIPVAAVMVPAYFLFPEIRPSPADRAVTGLSDGIAPGKIASLARSDRLAFRARFLGQAPHEEQLYWRVAVLEEGVGMSWLRGTLNMDQALRPSPGQAPVSYQIMSEPRLGSALPLLEHTLYARPLRKTEIGIFWDAAHRSYRSAHAILEVGSDLESSFVPPSAPPPLTIHSDSSERVRELVAPLKNLPVEEQISRLLAFFQSSFRYSLEPGPLRAADPLDEFLFESRRGYCEHFAASFASLLQLAGTRARVVTGFQGGSSLGDSSFYLVSDGDAHAWTEVWMGEAWQRVDPSAVVPGRSDEPERGKSWAAVPLAWLDYGSRQLGIKLRELTQDITMVWLLVFTLAGILLLSQLIRLSRRRRHEKPWERELARLSNRLRQRGFKRGESETMRSFLGRVAEALPEQREGLIAVGLRYDAEMFGPTREPSGSLALQRQLKALRQAIAADPRR